MEEISERIREVLESTLDGRGRPQALEQLTGIAAETWRKFLGGKQRATLAMLSEVSRQWPEYAFWLSTGVSDPKFGHVRPSKNSFESEREGGCLTALTHRAFMKRMATGELHPDEASRIDKGIALIRELGILESVESSAQVQSAPELIEEIRWIVIFLDNYILSLDADECVATYNFMRGRLKEIEQHATEKSDQELLDAAVRKFIGVKAQIEDRLKWMSERRNS